ncbi:MAG: hypothetical protein HUU50_08670 [Candidatus Brocadiae bacterium]|nr:hypothetical protein [Candidatus Brocadiia bacterium]
MPKIKNIHLLAHINEIPWEEAQLLFLEPGNHIGPENRYEIVSLIGTGSIGVVYLVKDHQNKDKLLTLKMILPYIFEDESKLEIFLDKITELQKVQKQPILPVYDFWKQNNLYFYSMEYIIGPSLEEWLEEYQRLKKCVPLPEVCKIIIQVCSGLTLLHKISSHYLLHPNNLLLKKEGKSYEVYISDFGLYYLREKQFWNRAFSLMGRETYLFSEPKNTIWESSRQHDIYSLGMLLHKMLFFSTQAHLKKQWPENREDVPGSLLSIMQNAISPGSAESSLTIDGIQYALEEILLEYKDCELSTAKKDWSYKQETTKKRLSLKNNPEYFIEESPKISFPSLPPKEVAFVKNADYNKLLLQARNRLDQKKYPEAIELLSQAFIIQENSIVSELLENAQSLLKRAVECKEEAQRKEKEDIRSAIALITMSIEIYPYDQEAKKILEIFKEKQEMQNEISEILKEGDQLEEKGKYEEAILLWKRKASVSPDNKELQDRIIQVLDIMGEEARESIESGSLETAQKQLDTILKYSQDPYFQELQKQIFQMTQKKQKNLDLALEQAEKHLQKKQFSAALDVWENQLKKMPQEKQIQQKILETQKILSLSQENEKEYWNLIEAAQKLEKREDYKGALQALEKIRKRRAEWVYSAPDPTNEIERLKKMLISMEYSHQAQALLLDVNIAISKKEWNKVEKILSEPVFQLSLIPSVQKSYKNSYLLFEKHQKRWQIINEIFKIALTAIGIGSFVVLYFFYKK